MEEATRKNPNFAGHYILTAWGCGTGCLLGAVIDAKTGKVYQWDFSICCWDSIADDNFKPIEFRLNSRLIVFSGARNEEEGDTGAHFYKFENGRFVHLQSLRNTDARAKFSERSGEASRFRSFSPPLARLEEYYGFEFGVCHWD